MSLIVQKYGGTSVGSIERINAVAERVKIWRDRGDQVVVVVSAMSGETDRLLGLAKEIQEQPNPREMDVLLSTGEQVTIALLSMAWNASAARPLLHRRPGPHPHRQRPQQGAHPSTSTAPVARPGRRARGGGRRVPGSRRRRQHHHPRPRRLGHHRGGLAAALSADECQIYTDVDGVYTTDPRIVPRARRLDRITFEEMLELASLGSKVLQIRAVEFAGKYNVPCGCSPASTTGEGTLIILEDEQWKQPLISGIAFTATRPSSPSSACPTARASPQRFSARSPTPTSRWT